MEIPFIQKYQPIHLKDFEIEDNLLNLIHTFIDIDNLNILIVADSGSGKSSIIFSIIKEYYKNNYDESNVLYINSLKEQGITFYRNDVKTFCQTKSSIHNKKKIVVLNDLDIINEQSQQVFRNCIDKYSNNVHFIASCCNTQKIIDSIQSRLSIIKMKSFNYNNLSKILNKVCLNESIVINDDAKEFVLSVSNNSVRILINYLEKLKLLSDTITKELAISLCTNINFNELEKYTVDCLNGSLIDAIKLIYNIYDCGYSVMDILDNYFLFIKSTSIINETEKYETIKLICKYITVFHNIHEDEIELSLFTNNLIRILHKNN